MTLNKKGQETFSISDAGKIGNVVFSDIISGVGDFKMKPVRGFVEIEISLLIEDNNVFKDDEARNSIIKIRVDLEEIEDLINGT